MKYFFILAFSVSLFAGNFYPPAYTFKVECKEGILVEVRTGLENGRTVTSEAYHCPDRSGWRRGCEKLPLHCTGVGR